jgi:hypothetical protein
MHRNARSRRQPAAAIQEAQPLRRPWKIFGAGGLHLLVAACGGRYWRHNDRFAGRQRTVALGSHRDVPLEKARQRHRRDRDRLAAGIDPSRQRFALRRRPVPF